MCVEGFESRCFGMRITGTENEHMCHVDDIIGLCGLDMELYVSYMCVYLCARRDTKKNMCHVNSCVCISCMYLL